MPTWPRDNQSALIAFYGDPGRGEVARQLVKIVPPFQMYYDGKPLRTITFHKKAAPALLSALNKIWEYYGKDQSTIDGLGISKTAGTYNPRKVRGSKTKWSNHAYGAAIDINAEENGFNVEGNIPLPVISAFKSEGFRWGGDYRGRKDPMHFEACSSGEPVRTFDQWLAHYGVTGMPVAAVAEPEVDVAEALDIAPDFAPTDISAAAKVALVSAIPAPDPKIVLLQKQLGALGYHEVGGVDGVAGSRTTAAIAAFKKDWNQPGAPIIDDHLRAAVAKAVAENWKRPIAPARAEATAAELAVKTPEIVPAIQNKKGGIIASVLAFFAAVFSAAADYFKNALEWLQPVKQFFAEVPAYVWFGLAGAAAVAVGWNAARGVKRQVDAFRSGERN